MEPTERIFAGELARSRYTAGELVITPSGARCGRIYLAGACTEISTAGGGFVRARVADPTGAFLLSSRGEYPGVVETLNRLTPPLFIAVTGTVNPVRNKSDAAPFVIPEAVAEIDRRTRDLWVARTADITIGRLEALAEMRAKGTLDPETARVLSLYREEGLTVGKIAAMVEKALESVQSLPPSGEPVSADPRGTICEILGRESGPRGMPVEDLLRAGMRRGYTEDALKQAIDALFADGDCYMPVTGHLKLL